MRQHKQFGPAFVLLTLAVLAAGCAETAGSRQFLSSTPHQPLTQYTDLILTVETATGITLEQYEKNRITRQIVKALTAEGPRRFNTINEAPPAATVLRADVILKQYDEGSSFARFLLAGVGQMHIDADLLLKNSETNDVLETYEVTKTFAWGGIYGAVTRLRDVEEGFAKTVAAVLLEKSE